MQSWGSFLVDRRTLYRLTASLERNDGDQAAGLGPKPGDPLKDFPGNIPPEHFLGGRR